MVTPPPFKKPDLDAFSEKFSKENTIEIFNQLSVQEYRHGKEFSEDLMINFLASFIGAGVFKILNDKPPKGLNRDDAHDYTLATFMRLREKVQQAVAAGFQGSIGTYSGKTVEYYCQINPVPDAPSKTLQ